MSQQTHSRLPQSRRKHPLLPLIVAKYLQTRYPTALDPFLAAAEIEQTTLDDPLVRQGVPDLRTLVEEYEAWVLEREMRAVSLADATARSAQMLGDGGNVPLRELIKRPVTEEAVETVLRGVRKTYDQIGTGGFLSVKWEKVAKREFDTGTASYRASYPHRIIVTSTDKTLKTIDPETGEVDQLLQPHKAAILSFAIHPTQQRYIITSSMDSTAILTDLITLQPLQTFHHAKFVVRCAFSPDGRWLATASYDRTIILYEDTQWGYPSSRPAEEEDTLDESDDPALARDPSLRYQERHKITLERNPESIVFDTASRYLMYTTRASHLLSYVQLPGSGAPPPPTTTTSPTANEPFTTRTKSFNPHPDDSHISFAVLNLVIDPTGRMVACQTGDHAGGTGERVLLYDVNLPPAPCPADPSSSSTPSATAATSRTSWLPTRTESSTIPPENQRLSVIWTGQEGDDYVLPRLAWLPDSSGIITTTTTGWLTLHSLAGETVARLKVHGGQGRSAGQGTSEVIRDVCVVGDKDDVAGWRVVSVGYDATVRIS